MGREIRMAPENWAHPQKMYGSGMGYQPMFDRTFADAAKEWRDEYAKWEAGDRGSHFVAADYPVDFQYWEWENRPPLREDYRPWADDDATWFQVWETVSEGTPVTPPFATTEELVEHLVTVGDDWDVKRGNGGWLRANAESFVRAGFAMSGVIVGGTMFAPRDGYSS